MQDTHVPLDGRTKIRERCSAIGFPFSFLELQAQHAFIRDEASKGRYDSALTRVCTTLMFEIFVRSNVSRPC